MDDEARAEAGPAALRAMGRRGRADPVSKNLACLVGIAVFIKFCCCFYVILPAYTRHVMTGEQG